MAGENLDRCIPDATLRELVRDLLQAANNVQIFVGQHGHPPGCPVTREGAFCRCGAIRMRNAVHVLRRHVGEDPEGW